VPRWPANSSGGEQESDDAQTLLDLVIPAKSGGEQESDDAQTLLDLVIPAKAGTQGLSYVLLRLGSRFRGNDKDAVHCR
jgi:hypothetical protein